MRFVALFLLLMMASCGKEEAKPVVIKERAKDPVCNMWVDLNKETPKILYDNAYYYFCCADCGATFVTTPAKYARMCRCKNFSRDCQCGHCQGKQIPCDCE